MNNYRANLATFVKSPFAWIILWMGICSVIDGVVQLLHPHIANGIQSLLLGILMVCLVFGVALRHRGVYYYAILVAIIFGGGCLLAVINKEYGVYGYYILTILISVISATDAIRRLAQHKSKRQLKKT